MKSILNLYKPSIENRIVELCASTQNSQLPWATDVAQRLADFCQRGKMIRGSIMVWTVDIFAGEQQPFFVDIAASIELLHAALLIHDDLIDHDQLRRGKESIHVQYEQLGKKQAVPVAKEFGEGMAICVGDIAIFGAFAHLSTLPINDPKIMQLITKEFVTVGFGEIHDIALGYSEKLPFPEEVLGMYKRKTARYTFSLPFLIGCILTKQPDSVQKNMEQLGEFLGMIYQLQDDLLTLTGTAETVGKTIGNDIAENKKTYAAILLWNRVNDTETQRLKQIFGNPNISMDDITIVQDLMKKYEIDTHISKQIDEYSRQSKQIIDALPVTSQRKEELINLLNYLRIREK